MPASLSVSAYSHLHLLCPVGSFDYHSGTLQTDVDLGFDGVIHMSIALGSVSHLYS
jgi:hypothetical protein